MGLQLIVRVKEKGAKGDKCYNFKREVNLYDPNLIALTFDDMAKEFNFPLTKIIKKLEEMGYKVENEKFFPFLNK